METFSIIIIPTGLNVSKKNASSHFSHQPSATCSKDIHENPLSLFQRKRLDKKASPLTS
jgi:hypothetical protein